MKLLLVCFLMMLMIYGCPSSKEGGSTQTSNAQTVQEKVQAIDNVAWYVKFEKGSEDGDWQSMIRVDLGGITSKTLRLMIIRLKELLIRLGSNVKS